MSQATRNALYQKITGGTAVTALLAGTSSVYYAQAPSLAVHPLIVFQQQTGAPTYSMKGTPFDTEVWQVKAVDRSTSSSKVESIARALDVLLTDGNLSISGYSQMYLKRESDVPSIVETVEGQEYRTAGAMFRLIYQA